MKLTGSVSNVPIVDSTGTGNQFTYSAATTPKITDVQTADGTQEVCVRPELLHFFLFLFFMFVLAIFEELGYDKIIKKIPVAILFFSPPVHIARWAHMRHFLSVTRH